MAVVAMSSVGGWQPDARAVRNDVARKVGVRAMETCGKVEGIVMQRHGAAGVMCNAACLMGGLRVAF